MNIFKNLYKIIGNQKVKQFLFVDVVIIIVFNG